MSCIGVRKPGWWIQAYSRFRGRDGHDELGSAEKEGSIRPGDLADGIYLDPSELTEHHGLWIPLRTETQRWFCEVISTIVRTRHKLETQIDNKRYVVLDEDEWRRLYDCFKKLTYVESGLGRSAKRLKAPEAFVHFAVAEGKLYIHDEGQAIPEEVKRLCRAAGETSIWGDGAVLRRAKLKSWLARAFALADLGAQNVTGPHLVRIGNDHVQWKWVPPLPRTIGKTRDQIQKELKADTTLRAKRRKSHARKDAAWISPTVI